MSQLKRLITQYQEKRWIGKKTSNRHTFTKGGLGVKSVYIDIEPGVQIGNSNIRIQTDLILDLTWPLVYVLIHMGDWCMLVDTSMRNFRRM
jgi:hypothetical protein